MKSAVKPETFKIHSYFNPPRPPGYDPREYLDGKVFSRTKQEFKDECDINVIVAQYGNGTVPWNARDPQNAAFIDLVDLPTLQEAENLLIEASARFDAVPAAIRAQFENDPYKFFAFVQDARNADKMVEMGLASRPEGWVPPTPQQSTGGTASAKNEPVKTGEEPKGGKS